MSLDKDLTSAIEQHLPSLVGKKLQERLAQVDTYEAKIYHLEKTIETLTSENKKYHEKNKELTLRDSVVTELLAKTTEREKVLVDVEHKLEIASLKTDFANDSAKTVERLFNTVFRNTTLRNNMIDSVTTDSYRYEWNSQTGQNESIRTGSYQMPVAKSETKTEE